MLAYIVKRILATIPVMLVVALTVFSLLFLAPGDPATMIAGDQASAADIERIRQSLGLDQSFLVQFGTWLWRLVHFDLGNSVFTGQPVTALMAERVGPTVSVMLLTLVLSISIAVPLGVVAAWKSGSWIDRAIMSISVVGFSVPLFVVGYVLAWAFALKLQWLRRKATRRYPRASGPGCSG